MYLYRPLILLKLSAIMTAKRLFSLFLLMTSLCTLSAHEPTYRDSLRHLTVVYTTDVHGNFFPYDFIRLQPAKGSMARVASYVEALRDSLGAENLLLLDNGDILQGQPTAYYYNYIDPAAVNIASAIYDFMRYDAATVGNHDIETGHAVYDKWKRQTSTPILGANVIDKATGRPYFTPYTVINRGGLKVAVIGLLTPAIPAWLPENQWSGMEFLPMQETARKWIKIVRETENPDIIIGLFHSGHDASKSTAGYRENESLVVARETEGFDAVLMGHDHQLFCDTVITPAGHEVSVLNPANNAMNVGVLDITETAPGPFRVSGRIDDIADIEPSQAFMDRFASCQNDVTGFVSRKIADITDSITTRDGFFGPSAFMTLLHKLQLDISGADISMAAPLTNDGVIAAGEMRVADMFTLYKYENFLCILRLTGREIKDYLEFSFSLWTECISDSNPHLIRFASDSPTPADNRLKNPSYNFDSASGIIYTVDITKPKGAKINIISLSSGQPFNLDSTYTVAVNSYRAGGGGDHLTLGSGISPSDLKARVVSSTDKDLRYYMMKAIEGQGKIHPEIEHNWRFIPEDRAAEAIAIDRRLLFGPDSSKNQK